MSENTFPFVDGPDPGFPDDIDAGKNRKAAFVAGGVAAALVLVAGGWFLLGGGGGSSEDAAFVVPHHARPAAAAPHAAKAPAKKLPVAYTAPLGRDPFKALYVVPAAAPAAAPGTAPAASTTTTTATTPTTSTAIGSTTPTKRYTLKLVSISKPSPEVRVTTWLVDGKKVSVLPGQRFGKFGEIVVLAFVKNSSGAVDRAIIQVGDDSPMDVSTGESVSVL